MMATRMSTVEHGHRRTIGRVGRKADKPSATGNRQQRRAAAALKRQTRKDKQ